jgi:hypothetical protein
MIIKSKMRALLAGALVCAAGVANAQNTNSYITFSVDMGTNILLGTFTPPGDVVNVRGTFNSWAGTETPLYQVGSSTVYTNTVADTNDVNGNPVAYIFNITGTHVGYETVPSGNNRAWKTSKTVGGTVSPPTPLYGDSGAQVTNYVTFQVDLSQAINLGQFTNGTTSWVELRGSVNGWTGATNITQYPSGTYPSSSGIVLTNNPNILVTNGNSIVTSNVYQCVVAETGSPWSAQDFKFVIQPGTLWDSPSAVNSDGGGNRFYQTNPTNNNNLVLPVVNFSDQSFAPLCTVTFSVDMSGPAQYDTGYDPTTVRVDGTFNGWGADLALTNNPAAANTNIFSGSAVVGQASAQQYQFRYNSSGNTVYDHYQGNLGGQGNRSFTAPVAQTDVLPVVFFNDTPATFYLTAPVTVTFTVNMNGAVGTDGTVWNSADDVFVNGPWPAWQAWSALTLSDQLTEVGTSGIYTGTVTLPSGQGVLNSLTYKYSINGIDNEAGSNINHNRSIRQASPSAYSFPQDTFGSQYVEPPFGSLLVGKASGGTVPLSWNGRPGVQVQVSSSLKPAVWTSLPQTDGTNWTAGTATTIQPNGFISQTNYPASSGNLFFRLVDLP